uniref:Uncharacterized protein n=1 Tax=Cacopsylla melanoneura TaxID=428564 RepID=A0A8D8QRJ2_9HEMI
MSNSNRNSRRGQKNLYCGDKPLSVYKVVIQGVSRSVISKTMVAQKVSKLLNSSDKVEFQKINGKQMLGLCRSKETANKLVSNNDICSDFNIFIPFIYNHRFGVIKDIDVAISEKEILDNIIVPSSPHTVIIKIKRLMFKGTPTKNVLVCFESDEKPDFISLWNLRISVEHYSPRVRLCGNCYKFGHTFNFCSKAKSSAPVKDGCPNCIDSHSPFSFKCPKFVENKTKLNIMQQKGLTFWEAHNVYKLNPNANGFKLNPNLYSKITKDGGSSSLNKPLSNHRFKNRNESSSYAKNSDIQSNRNLGDTSINSVENNNLDLTSTNIDTLTNDIHLSSTRSDISIDLDPPITVTIADIHGRNSSVEINEESDFENSSEKNIVKSHNKSSSTPSKNVSINSVLNESSTSHSNNIVISSNKNESSTTLSKNVSIISLLNESSTSPSKNIGISSGQNESSITTPSKNDSINSGQNESYTTPSKNIDINSGQNKPLTTPSRDISNRSDKTQDLTPFETVENKKKKKNKRKQSLSDLRIDTEETPNDTVESTNESSSSPDVSGKRNKKERNKISNEKCLQDHLYSKSSPMNLRSSDMKSHKDKSNQLKKN